MPESVRTETAPALLRGPSLGHHTCTWYLASVAVVDLPLLLCHCCCNSPLQSCSCSCCSCTLLLSWVWTGDSSSCCCCCWSSWCCCCSWSWFDPLGCWFSRLTKTVETRFWNPTEKLPWRRWRRRRPRWGGGGFEGQGRELGAFSWCGCSSSFWSHYQFVQVTSPQSKTICNKHNRRLINFSGKTKQSKHEWTKFVSITCFRVSCGAW